MKTRNDIFSKIIIALLLISVSVSCDMNEKPMFPAADNLFSTVTGAETVLNGCYSTLNGFNYYGADFMHLTYFASGLYNSNRAASFQDILVFQQTPSLNFVENVWQAAFQAIGRANDLIDNLNVVTLPDEAAQENILGQAYFIRALSYFNLVRIYGGVPLHTKTVTVETLNRPRATTEEVYLQIIDDLKLASDLLKGVGDQQPGRPAAPAANMLLAKVYMHMAGDLTAAETNYWQLAYDEAIKVYGQYTLVDDYRDLWHEATCNNTTESVFEVQGNEENTLRMYQLFTPSNGNLGMSVWGRIKPNCELLDMHLARYPGDPRYDMTFLTEWPKYKANGTYTLTTTYPLFTNRGNKDRSYPWLYKYYIKDHTRLSYNTIMNFVVLRYADLLLMLAEIENELNGPDNAYQYVNEVLARARNSADVPSLQPEDWSGMTQAQFRDSIMFEYRYELLGEGHEYFNDRRRGYEYFKANVIDIHNNTPYYDFLVEYDVLLPDNPRNMLMPIPLSEIVANPNINVEDQNPGY